jgi:hypothetical protein
VIGHERGFRFRVYNPEKLDLAMLREVVEVGLRCSAAADQRLMAFTRKIAGALSPSARSAI